ncbi:MAG: PEP-CTERM sorting domain-containing protein [Candidatus Omnitrophica bacterium]|nr:PEP-CTERM sorting domain-containing protein [Candidatus Omnitrophota bacterium]
MRKKFMLLAVLFVFAGAFFGGEAGAVFDVDTTDSGGTHQGSFGYNELPYLKLTFPDASGEVTLNWWDTPDLGSDYEYWATLSSSGTDTLVTSFDDIPFKNLSGDTFTWRNTYPTIRAYGTWNIKACYYPSGSSCSGTEATTSFNIVPEPVSSALFLIGGMTFVAARRRRNRRVRA